MRPISVQIERADARHIAVVRRRASLNELARVMPAACGVAWEFVGKNAIAHAGHNIVLYHDTAYNFEAGVEVMQPFQGDGQVVCSSTPVGRAAAAEHWGSYGRLPDTHVAIRRWRRDNGHRLAGPNWEFYGHWDDDPAKLLTDVYYLLDGD